MKKYFIRLLEEIELVLALVFFLHALSAVEGSMGYYFDLTVMFVLVGIGSVRKDIRQFKTDLVTPK